ncbi:hypothetical protein CHS0354_016282 [Potamilus streckersoni]|uniref:Uncharacterized protein n=1 Tax=Potamilus streckersoni TaxID=2493646 RepID=A0AAE0RXN5_9BIVA|nr:hypothetical protein CHS0354_016282 [Potamilus streckersoni]
MSQPAPATSTKETAMLLNSWVIRQSNKLRKMQGIQNNNINPTLSSHAPEPNTPLPPTSIGQFSASLTDVATPVKTLLSEHELFPPPPRNHLRLRIQEAQHHTPDNSNKLDNWESTSSKGKGRSNQTKGNIDVTNPQSQRNHTSQKNPPMTTIEKKASSHNASLATPSHADITKREKVLKYSWITTSKRKES